MADSLLSIFAGKLGMYSPKLLSKAAELNRLFEVKASCQAFQCLNLTGTAQIAICLELAAQLEKVPVNKNEMVKLSGLKKRIYQNCIQILGNMLEVSNTINLNDLGVQFGCSQVVELAESILKRYSDNLKTKYAYSHVDSSQPVYVVSAFYVACRKSKIKVDKQKLLEMSRAQRGAFLQLLNEMEKIASEQLVAKPQKRKMKVKPVDIETKRAFPERRRRTVKEDEEYSEWMERMLRSKGSEDE